ncbi:OmpH family outer membrane protein [Thiohalorhabdus sp.]|uniref:OmpH family outer membrane protein n=1 Tax=Thiohalorhabdus sp. TaxID=3094134 RepID=UPI002FC2FE6F
MGHRWKSVMLAVLVAVLVPAAPAVAAEYKIGYVDVRKVVQESEQAQQAKGELETKVAERKEQLARKRQKVQDLQKELENQGSLMSEEQEKAKKRRLQEAMRELRRLQQQAQEDLDTRKNQVLKDIYDQVFQIANRIGKQEEFDLILTAPSALYVADRVDLTQRVLAEVNDGGSGG